MVNILVVGSGGREHALSWKLSQSKKVDTVYTAPGNGGTKNNISIDVTNLDELVNFAQKNNCFTVCIECFHIFCCLTVPSLQGHKFLLTIFMLPKIN